jgi:hypothetical protein
MNLKTDTLVWYDGAGDWKEAGKVEELNSLFVMIPPPLKKSSDLRSASSSTLPASATNKAGQAIGKTVAGSGTLRSVGILAIVAILCYGGYNVYQSKQADNHLSAVEAQKNYVRNNIHSFVTAGNSAYKINGLGGIYGLSITVANNTDYILDNVRVMIRYIKANGETWKEEPLDFVLVGPHQKMELRAPDSDRGTSIDYKIVAIKSGALGL